MATRNLFGIVLFEPVYGLTDRSDWRLDRKRELAAFVRGALAPAGGEA